ncbi:MAG: RNA-guided endonuclease InsQ/TnpB family protein [Clostridium sp.]|uniref:RNA-guided endonuclease InsQ/TnpB family protein n=1 Tax=Clostridium sp. TaxID=1506 RepID=UPI003F3BC314
MEFVVTAKVKLLPNEEQKAQLIETMSCIKSALNYTSKVAYNNNLLSSMKKLQNIVYKELREIYNLKSQMACNVCSVVAGTYASMKANKENTLALYKKSKLQYSYNRDYSFLSNGLISIGTVNKRIKLPYTTKGLEHYFDGSFKFGTGTLVYKKGKFFLHISVKKEIQEPNNISNIVGVDLGMRFLLTATDSNNNHLFINGKQIISKKAKFLKQRKDLQSLETKSAKRKLKKLSGKENRYQTNVNHCVSKALIGFAKKDSLIVLEDLTNININTKIHHNYRYYRMSWAFAQLRQMIEYKGLMNGIKVIDVDPKFTSQKCPKCGYTHKDNRDKKTHTFICNSCNYKSNDDRVGALNLRQMGIEYHHNNSMKETN